MRINFSCFQLLILWKEVKSRNMHSVLYHFVEITDSKIEWRHGASDYFQVPGVVGMMELEFHVLQSSRLSLLLIDLKQRPVTLKWRHLIVGHHTLTYLAEGACIFQAREKSFHTTLHPLGVGHWVLEAKWNTSPHFSRPWRSNRDGLTWKNNYSALVKHINPKKSKS